MIILAIDPGSTQSGWVTVYVKGNGVISEIIGKGKSENATLVDIISNNDGTIDHIICEEIAGGWGDRVARTVFETAYQIGEYRLAARQNCTPFELLNRDRVAKTYRVKKSDPNIRQAVINRYAPYTKNDGKGSKAEPGFFYGMAADAWQAFAIADAWCIRNPHLVRRAA